MTVNCLSLSLEMLRVYINVTCKADGINSGHSFQCRFVTDSSQAMSLNGGCQKTSILKELSSRQWRVVLIL